MEVDRSSRRGDTLAGLRHGMAVRWGAMTWCVRAGQFDDVR